MYTVLVKAGILILSISIVGGLQYLINRFYIKRIKGIQIDLSKSLLEYFRVSLCNYVMGALMLSYFFCRLTGDTSDKVIYYIVVSVIAIGLHSIITLIQLRRVTKCSKNC